MDFSNYKFHCSGIKYLFVKSRSKDDPLSETTKAYLREIWIEEAYARKKEIITKYMEKGTIVESDGLDLVKAATGVTYFKNKKTLENDWIIGTPDINTKDALIDIKSSWDIWTFAAVDEKRARSDYYYQLLGYMWLTDKTSSDLIYVLVNTPDEIIQSELYKLSFRNPDISNKEDVYQTYLKNYKFDDIPAVNRVKSFRFEIDPEPIEVLKKNILIARDYMSKLSL
jgi:hypothetical protein